MTTKTLSTTTFVAAITLLAAGPALAQPTGDEPPVDPVPESMPEPMPEPEPTPEPMPEPTPEPTPTPTGGEVAMAAPSPTGISTTGNFGVGAEATLAGLGGIAGRYQLSDEMALYGVVALGLTTVDGASSAYAIGAGVNYRLRTADTTAISLVGGLDVSRVGLGMGNATQFGISAGVLGEWFIDPRIALYAKAGVGFAYASSDSTTRTRILLGGDTQTSFGAMYWFR